jgi:hypothetical protein
VSDAFAAVPLIELHLPDVENLKAKHVDALQGWLEARFEQGVNVDRTLTSRDDLVGIA